MSRTTARTPKGLPGSDAPCALTPTLTPTPAMSSSLTTKTDGSLFASSASSAGAEPTDDTEMIAHLTFFGVVLWRETRERTPTEEECRRILRVVLAPLAGGTSAPPR